jgi:hypothetical protein
VSSGAKIEVLRCKPDGPLVRLPHRGGSSRKDPHHGTSRVKDRMKMTSPSHQQSEHSVFIIKKKPYERSMVEVKFI